LFSTFIQYAHSFQQQLDAITMHPQWLLKCYQNKR